MMKTAILSVALVLCTVAYGFCEDTGLDEFALRACLSNCYSTFSPNKQMPQFYDCLMRCKSDFEQRNKKHSISRQDER